MSFSQQSSIPIAILPRLKRIAIPILLAAGLAIRLLAAFAPHCRDYDEGVYVQSLFSMREFHLYREIFYSQPPFFLPALYPAFIAFGSSLLSARISVLLYFIIGCIGCILTGNALGKWRGVVVGLFLLQFNLNYFVASTTVQAEGVFVNFLILSVGAALKWWENPRARGADVFSALAGVALTLSIFGKLFGVVGIIPLIVILFSPSNAEKALTSQEMISLRLRAVIISLVAIVATTAIILLPFSHDMAGLIKGNIGLHVSSKQSIFQPNRENLISLARMLIRQPLFYLSLFGIFVGARRKHPLLLAGILFLVCSFYIMVRQSPLFIHHYVTIVPSLLFLSLIPLSGEPDIERTASRSRLVYGTLVLITGLIGILQIFVNGYHELKSIRSSQGLLVDQVARDMGQMIPAEKWVITDSQDIAVLAKRVTPPDLVDTSFVRIGSGLLTEQSLIETAKSSRVGGVLFFSDRFHRAEFYNFVTKNYRKAATYSENQTLWVKP